MLPDEIDHYLAEIRRVLRPGGRCMASMLTKDRFSPERSIYRLAHSIDEECICWSAEEPTRSVAVTRARIDRLAGDHGLRVGEVRYGFWDGVTRASNAHDLYVFEPG
jgi:ubiquinone/menaquinone biosynthesis C-methylase UbiE